MRPTRLIRAFALVAALGAITVAGAQTASGGTGTAEQTQPRIHPAYGTRTTHFTLTFMLRETPGHQGVTQRSYRVQVDQPAGSRAACTAPAPPGITTGTQNTTVSISLAKPRYGWCHGHYDVSVLLQRGPYCPKPQPGQPPQPCPEFASQEFDVGHTSFTVRKPRPPAR